MKKLLLFLMALNITAAAAAHAEELEVITYNTAMARALWKDYNPCVLQRLEVLLRDGLKPSKKPQVLLFQEVFSLDARARLQEWAKENNYYISKKHSSRTGLVTLTNLPVKSENFSIFSCQSAWMINYGTHTTEVQLGNRSIQVVNTHTYYSEGSEPNKCHVHNLDEIVKRQNKMKLPRIIGGDINIGPNVNFYEETYSQVETIWNPFIAKMAPYKLVSSSKHTWDTNNPLTRPYSDPKDLKSPRVESHLSSTLDHIFVSSEFKSVSSDLIFNTPFAVPNCQLYEVEAGKTYLSDHYGISAIVSLEESSK